MSRTRLTAVVLSFLIAPACSDGGPLQPDTSLAGLGSPQLASANATEVGREFVEFTLTPQVCPSLTTTVTGSGVFRFANHLSVAQKGAKIPASFHQSFQGTATGADGSTYRFTYNNNTRFTTEALPPFDAFVVDKFYLIGQGGVRDIRVQQRAHFRFNPDGTVTLISFEVRGDPVECDPV
jgi:hypothetical protein